jgi:hypothetical protein
MEESASKRRRISPRLSAAASSRDATPEAREQPNPRPRRPSFASPTKASLARHNPGVLERRRSSSPAKQPTARPSVNIDSSQPTPVASAASPPTGNSAQTGDDAARQNFEAITDSGRSARNARGGMAAKPRRSSIKPTPRPLPPPGDDEDDVLHFSQRLQRTQPLIFSPDMGIALPQNQEPDLPPVTPDVVSSTPPRGIHSSPSRWREKNRQKKTSPLKPAPERPEKAGPSKTLTSRGPKRLSEMAAQSKNKPGTDPSTSAARNVPEHDPNAAKKNERDALLEDIAQMKSALESIEAENERIRFMQKSGRVLTLNDADVVSDLVQQYLMSQAPQARDRPSQQLLKLALNPKSLLPFGKPSKPIATVSDDAELPCCAPLALLVP